MPMKRAIGGAALAATLMMTTVSDAREYEVVVRNDIVFAEHDGTKLLGDLYLPKGLDKAPVLVGVHGGAVGARFGDANARQYRREIPRRRPDGEPQSLFRRFAVELCHGRQEHDALPAALRP